MKPAMGKARRNLSQERRVVPVRSRGRAFHEYHKVELYLPLDFVPAPGRELVRIPYAEILRLGDRLQRKFGGFTSANPAIPAAYLGYWKGTVDRLFYLFVLVDSRTFQRWHGYFWELKAELEQRYHQEIVLITHYPLFTFGSLSDG